MVMKVFKGLIIAIISLFILFLVVTVFLPSEYHIERKIEIQAPPPIPFYLINEFRNWKYWDTWWHLDTNQTRTYFGQILDLNSKFTWFSKNKDIGQGFVQCVEAKPFESIKLSLGFGYEFQSTNHLKFMHLGDKLLLTWSMHGDLQFLGKWFRFFLDDVIGKDLEINLKNIKEISETIAKNKFAFFNDTIPETKIIFISDSINNNSANLSQKINACLLELRQFANQSKKSSNSAVGILSLKSIDNKKFYFEVCLPVANIENLQPSERIKIGTIPKQHALRSVYFGALNEQAKIIDVLNYITSQNKIEPKGTPLLIYYTGLLSEKVNENLAIIYIPL